MSITNTVSVRCDGCGAWTAHTVNATAAAARAAARTVGWVRVHPHRPGPFIDLCPNCRRLRKAAEHG